MTKLPTMVRWSGRLMTYDNANIVKEASALVSSANLEEEILILLEV